MLNCHILCYLLYSRGNGNVNKMCVCFMAMIIMILTKEQPAKITANVQRMRNSYYTE